ncbi:MAG: hypothetical protein RLZZ498_1389 [Pseudomonadota bacterium]|jgi:hypothetical protein
MKNKTLAAWITFLFGPIGLHRFYLYGWTDTLGWLIPIPTALGIYGFERIQEFGLDDVLSWWLLPIFGFTLAATCLNAIVFGLMRPQQWNQRFNPGADPEHAAGQTQWATIGAIVASLMVGTAAMLSGLAYGFQRYFESTIVLIQ